LYNPHGTVEPFAVKFPCEDESFDFCFATSVFTHLYAGTVALYIAEAARCLRQKGIFFFTMFALLGKKVEGNARFSFHLGPDSTTFITDNKVAEEAVGFNLGYIVNLLKAAGFDNIKHYPGGWTGNASAIAGQDIVICEKVI
ncbi:MAG: class I SAM-dependent methyltransferase, partial [Nitrospira sp.]|nr:class I SAM-dependent methyltransferase [Nitrospira sp.]